MMRSQLLSMLSRLPWGVRGILAGMIAGLFVLVSMPALRDWSATDLLHGHGFWVIVGLIAVFATASPLRARGPKLAFLHGFMVGCALLALAFFLLDADLFARDERLAGIVLLITFVAAITRLIVGPLSFYGLCLRDLTRDPSAHRILKLCGAVLNGADLSDPLGLHPRIVKLFNGYIALRSRLGVGPSRCYAVEWALEAAVNKREEAVYDATRQPSKEVLNAAVRALATATTAELEFGTMIATAGFTQDERTPFWAARALTAWDLIRHAERIVGVDFTHEREQLLAALESRAKGRTILVNVVRAMRDHAPDLNLVDVFLDPPTFKPSRHADNVVRQSDLRFDRVAAVLAADQLVEAGLATWAMGILDGPYLEGSPSWLEPSIARVQFGIERCLLLHEQSLEKSDIAIHTTRRSIAALSSDAPELARASASVVIPSLRGGRATSCRKRARGLSGTEPLYFDPGPGRLAATVVFASAAAVFLCLYLGITSRVLWGEAFKPLRDMHRASDYHDRTLTAADINPSNQELVVATLGGGLHRVDTNTFRIRTEDSATSNLSSSHLSGVAVNSAGVIAVATNEGSNSDNPTGASGVDVRGPNGWRTVIPAVSAVSDEANTQQLPTILATDGIRSVAAIGNDKAILTKNNRLLLYETAARRLRLIGPNGGTGLSYKTEVLTIAAIRTAKPELAMLIKDVQNSTVTTRVVIVSISSSDTYQIEMTGRVGDEDSPEIIQQMAYAADSIWTKTAAGRLYSFNLTEKLWKLRIDGASGLDLGRIRDIVIAPGPDKKAAVWVTENDEKGVLKSIRVRTIDERRIFALEPWRRARLKPNSLEEAKSILDGSILRLGREDAAPVAWFDSARNQPSLFIPSRNKSGIHRFFTDVTSPTSVGKATISVDFIGSPEHQVLGIDLMTGTDSRLAELLILLEKNDGTERCVIRESIDNLKVIKPSKTNLVQRSIRPDPNQFAGSTLIGVGQHSTEAKKSRIDFVASSGRLMTYDRALHGYQDPPLGVPIMNGDRPVDRLRTADFSQDKMTVLEESGRVLQADLPDVEFGPETTIPARIVHQPRGTVSPSSSLVPRCVASQSGGVDVLFIGETNPDVAEAWHLGMPLLSDETVASDKPLFGWSKLDLANDQRIRVNSITRVQDGDRLGQQIALNEGGKVVWRDRSGWRFLQGGQANEELISMAGGTLIDDSAAITRVVLKNGIPVAQRDLALWTHASALLTHPISDVAATVDSSGATHVVVGHATGLAPGRGGDLDGFLDTFPWRDAPEEKQVIAAAIVEDWELVGVEEVRDDRVEVSAILDPLQAVDVVHPSVRLECAVERASNAFVADAVLDGLQLRERVRDRLLRPAGSEEDEIAGLGTFGDGEDGASVEDSPPRIGG